MGEVCPTRLTFVFCRFLTVARVSRRPRCLSIPAIRSSTASRINSARPVTAPDTSTAKCSPTRAAFSQSRILAITSVAYVTKKKEEM